MFVKSDSSGTINNEYSKEYIEDADRSKCLFHLPFHRWVNKGPFNMEINGSGAQFVDDACAWDRKMTLKFISQEK